MRIVLDTTRGNPGLLFAMMRGSPSWVYVLLFLVGVAGTAQGRVDPGADTWLILEDIGPFVWDGRGIVVVGRPGLYGGVFPSDADGANLVATTLYTSGDPLQGGSVSGVDVLRQGQTRYFDHLIESQFRSVTDDADDARLDSPLTEMYGEVGFFVCGSPPDCKPREYIWKSGTNLRITVNAAAGEEIALPSGSTIGRNIPGPEPTEVLQAYLAKYPSSLEQYVDSDERTLQWQIRETELQLAQAHYGLNRTPPKLSLVGPRLVMFVVYRERFLNGPAARPELPKIEAITKLPEADQLTRFNDKWQEYHAWWVANHGAPAELYLPPTRSPVPSP